jgi:hypothetical protein
VLAPTTAATHGADDGGKIMFDSYDATNCE